MKELKVYMVIQEKVQNEVHKELHGVGSCAYCAGVFLDKDDAIDFIKELTNNDANHVNIFGRVCNSDGTEWIGTEFSAIQKHNSLSATDYEMGDFDIRYRLLKLTCGDQEKHPGGYPFLGGGMYYK